MNQRYGSEIPEEYCQQLSGWTGAEIEQLAKDSLFDGLEEALKTIVPLSKTMKEEISALQQWAATRARRANTPEETDNQNRKEDQIAMSHISKIELEVKDLGSPRPGMRQAGAGTDQGTENLQMVRTRSTVRPLPSGCPERTTRSA